MSEELTEKLDKLELTGEPGASNEKKKKKKKKNKKKNAEPSKPALELLGERQMMPQFKDLDLSTELKEERQNHPFWASQPVLNMKEGASQVQSEPVEVKTLDDVQKTPLSLPEGFEWVEIDVTNDAEMETIYELLRLHYVTDDDGMFRFDYSIPLLRWAMCPPGWKKIWHIGVMRSKNKQMVGFITGVPCVTRVYEEKVKMVEINFLCVHKLYRDKRIAPVLIKEITRRVNLQNIWQAVFTAGVVLPHPISSCRYYHRSLNPKKLIDIKFSHRNPKLTMSATVKLYSLPKEPLTPGLRKMEKKDIKATCLLLNEYLRAFHLAVEFTEEEFEHWFLFREGVIFSYVVENPKTHLITDFISYYRLPSSILGHSHHKTLEAAYSFYNVALGTPWVPLMKDALILAKKDNFDVFNCLDLMENEKFIKELKFGKGDGNLQYYLFNWKCAPTKPQGIGLVLM